MKPSWPQKLSQWYKLQARPLPWRKNHDPYQIWISEVMLQQTQVTTVLPYYAKFMAKFPTVQSLANAKESEVLTLWSGLGYYSRARNLHRGAQFVVEKYRGSFPNTREAMLEIAGVGPYTAGAVLSIAYDLPEPLVDGNVQRVFARFFGIRESLQAQATQKQFWLKASEAVKQAQSPRIFNQALMELGATVCIKGTPRCGQCPIQNSCIASKNNWQQELPLKKVQKEKVHLWWAPLVLEAKGKIYLKKNPKGEWWADLWDFPRVAADKPEFLENEIERMGKKLSYRSKRHLRSGKHNVTHHHIHVTPYHFTLDKMQLVADDDGEWFLAKDAEGLALSSLARKVLAHWAE